MNIPSDHTELLNLIIAILNQPNLTDSGKVYTISKAIKEFQYLKPTQKL